MKKFERIRQESRAVVEAQIEARKASDLARLQAYIASAFADGNETADFKFNAFSLWGHGSGSQPLKDLYAYLKANDLSTDDWGRAVWTLSQHQAQEIARLAALWNADWEYAVTHEDSDYNAYTISFSIASGSEHQITVYSPNGHPSQSWQGM